jgi:hypothetical protein
MLIQNKVMRQIDAKPLYTCDLQRPDFWRYQIGLNVISADTKNKVTNILSTSMPGCIIQ